VSEIRKHLGKTVSRFMRFGLVGGSGVLVDMGLLFVFADARMLGWGLSISKTLAAEAAIVNNFVWNDLWTFRDRALNCPGWRLRASRFGRFNLICLAGIGLNVALLNALVHWGRLNVYVANGVAIFVVSLWNFAMNLRFGWGVGRGAGERGAGERLRRAKIEMINALDRSAEVFGQGRNSRLAIVNGQ
jgi:dolichol-phosphate mannosyltransferase